MACKRSGVRLPLPPRLKEYAGKRVPFLFSTRLSCPERPAGSGKVRGSTPLTSTVKRDTQVGVSLFYFPPRLRRPERPAGSGKVVKVDGCLLIVDRKFNRTQITQIEMIYTD